MRIVVPIASVVMIIAGCHPADPAVVLDRFAQAVRTSVSASEVQAWGSSLSTNPVGTVVGRSDLPQWAQRLPDSPMAQIVVDTKTGDRVVTLTAGGGFGMWDGRWASSLPVWGGYNPPTLDQWNMVLPLICARARTVERMGRSR
jgi:hypothetical protein